MSLSDDGTSLSEFKDRAREIDSIGAEFYQCAPDGTVKRASGIPETKFAEVVQIAHQNRVTIFGLVGNPNFDPAPVEAFLADESKRSAEAEALAKAAVTDGLDGIDVDFENLKPEDRDNFSLFVEALSNRLHSRHKLLAIELHEKEKEPGDGDASQSEDYARIGKAVDRARIMCFDEHEEMTEAGPIADPNWVERIMTFAVGTIPKKKLEIGIPAYGYDWSLDKPAALDWKTFQALPGSNAAVRDPASNELVLKLDTSSAWICDSLSETPKMALAKKLGIRGAYLFRLGTEDPLWWRQIPTKSN